MERFRAYEGGRSYAFISYAHMDSDRVYEIISALNNDGFRVWYDQGIEIARRYKAVINEHIEKCSAFVVFATREGINRPEVIDECAYAIALRKKMIIVYLEDIPAGELDAALRATFAINQRVMWGELADWERNYKLREALVECGGEPKAQPVTVNEATAQSAPAAAAAMAAPTAPKAETVSSPLLERGFSLGKRGWAALVFCAVLLLLPVLFFYEFIYSGNMGFPVGGYSAIFFGGVHDIVRDSAVDNILFSIDSVSVSAIVQPAAIFLMFNLLKVLPSIYAFAAKPDTADKRRIYKGLNAFCITTLSVAYVMGAAYIERTAYGSRPACVLVWHLFGMVRDAAIIAAGIAAVNNCFGSKSVSRKTAVRSRNICIAALITIGLLFALINILDFDQFYFDVTIHNTFQKRFGIYATSFFSTLVSKLISFPWLALFLMKVATDNAHDTVDHKMDKRISKTVTVVSAILTIYVLVVFVLSAFGIDV